MNGFPAETFAYEAGLAASQETEEEIRRRRAAARRRPGGRPPARPRPPARIPGPRARPALAYPWPVQEPPDTASPQDSDSGSASDEPPAPAGNEYVRWVQSALNQILGLQLLVDGVMNAQVRKAVMEFQRSRRLPADGIIGPDTERALRTERSRASSAAREAGDFEAAVIPNTTSGSPAGGTAIPIYDRTQQTPRTQRHGMRSLSTIDALVLHQMAFSRGSDPNRYDTVRAHFAILPDGKILQLHPIEALLWSSHGFNRRSVAVEFAGNFPDIRGRCWQASRFGCHTLTPEQIAAGRYLVWHLKNTIGLRYVFAHRQSSDQRTNDPGPDIWYNVGQWAIDTLGIGDGGPGYKIGTGAAIPDAWRTWHGQIVTQEIDRRSPDYVRWVQSSLNQIMRAQLAVDGAMGPITRSAVRSFQQRMGLEVDGVVGPRTDAAIRAALSGTPSAPVSPRPASGQPNIVSVRGIRVARQIAPQVEALLAAAEADGIRLSGGGWRSREAQVELRRRHCGPTPYDIYERSSSECSPPTARPGHSMHEQGLAIDFTYNGGQPINSRDNPAFRWLSQNATRFGLLNLPSEPWHWSVNGR